MHAILSQWIGGANTTKSPITTTDTAAKESKSKLSTTKDASFIGVMMKLLGVNKKNPSTKEQSADSGVDVLRKDKQDAPSKDKQAFSAAFVPVTTADAKVMENDSASTDSKKALRDGEHGKTSSFLAQTRGMIAVKENGKAAGTAQQTNKPNEDSTKNIANSLPVMNVQQVKESGEVLHSKSGKPDRGDEDIFSFLGKYMMSTKNKNTENTPDTSVETVPQNGKKVYKKNDGNTLPFHSLKNISQKEVKMSRDGNDSKENIKAKGTDGKINANQKIGKSLSTLKSNTPDTSQNKSSFVNADPKSGNKIQQRPHKSQNPHATIKKESITSWQSQTEKVSKPHTTHNRSSETSNNASGFLGNNRLKVISTSPDSRPIVKQDFTLFKSVSTPADLTASPAGQTEIDSDTSKEFKDDSHQQFKEIHLNNLKTSQFAEAAGHKSFGRQLAQVGRQQMSQAPKTSRQMSTQWKHHRFVLKDGNAIHIAARNSEGSLQLQLNAGNGELGKMLHQHLHEIQQHVQQQLNIEIDLQLQDFGGQQPDQESETASRNQPKGESKMNEDSLVPGVNRPAKTQQVRYFGFNKNEWTA